MIYCACIYNTKYLPPPLPTTQGEEPEYLEQPSRTDVSKQLKEDSVRAITKAFNEQEDKNPEAIMHLVRKAKYLPSLYAKDLSDLYLTLVNCLAVLFTVKL